MPESRVTPRPLRTRPGNRLLAALPDADYARIAPKLTTVVLSQRQVLQQAQAPLRQVFFMNGGLGSLTGATSEGTTVEVASVGDEGFVNVEAILGADVAGRDAMLQVPDPRAPETTAEVMSLADFTDAVSAGGAFRDAMQRYSRGFIATVMQSATCLAVHPVHERCCRWLLTAHDRLQADRFALSHEFLAMMLGASRPTVTIVAGTLQKAGLIQYVHGRMTIVDRPALEQASCECYGVLKAEYLRLGL